MRELKLKSGTYRLPPLDFELAKAFLAWAQTQRPDPYEPLLHLKDVLKDNPQALKGVVDDLIREARKPLTLDSPFVQDLLGTPAGSEQMLLLMFRRHHPSMTAEQALALHQEAHETYGTDYLVAQCGAPAPR